MNLVIFDIDGTLCFSRYIDDKCFIRAFEDVTGKQFANTNWNDYKNITDFGIITELYRDFINEELNSEYVKRIQETYVKYLKAELYKDESKFVEIPGARKIIDYLNQHKDYIVCFATGGFLESAIFKLSKLGFITEGIMLNGCDEFQSKAEIINDVILKTRNKYGVKEYDKIFYIGDREYDYKTAKELNIDFIGMDYKNKGSLKDLGVLKVINNFSDINEFIKLLT